jgi:hypothetical protein
MRYVFDNQKEAKKMGINGSKLASKQFEFSVVGKLMAARIKEIEEGL